MSDEKLPWCPECQHYAVPDENHNCGDCGANIVFVGGPVEP